MLVSYLRCYPCKIRSSSVELELEIRLWLLAAGELQVAFLYMSSFRLISSSSLVSCFQTANIFGIYPKPLCNAGDRPSSKI